MGSGFLESIYHKSLHIELEKSGLVSEVQNPVKVYYDGQPVGDFFADIIVSQSVGCRRIEGHSEIKQNS